ncbi:MAG: DNA repair exonuclease [candidate division KSB1 bacterium]|nr:DNA repair exonuclease [candidate division KSB1 bacterium]
MRFIHFADTHLGYSDYSKVDPVTGVNRREQDFYQAWWHVINAVLAEQPDFVVHAGDLFQSPRPNNRAIAVALEGLARLADANIPLVMIAGNHSTPRVRALGNIFEALTVMPNVHACYQGRYEKFILRHPTSGKSCAIHCLPHCSLTTELEKAYTELHIDETASWNMLVAHGGWRKVSGEDGVDTRMGEFNEQFLEDPEARLGRTFDYIALGHYHRYLAMNDHTFYSGSTERTSFNEAGYTSGYIRGDLERRTWEYVMIPSRPMCRLKPVDCTGKSPAEIMRELEQRAAMEIREALVSIELQNLSRDTYLQLDLAAIDQLFSAAFHFERHLNVVTTVSRERRDEPQALGHIGSLRDEFSRYLAANTDGTLPRAELEALGLRYLMEAESKDADLPPH